MNSSPEPPAHAVAILETTVRVPAHVVCRSFQAETLLLNLQTGQYHGVNDTGGRFLKLLEPSDGRLASAVKALADEYGLRFEEVASDMAAFCGELQTRGLVKLTRPATGEEVVYLSPDCWTGALSAPSIERRRDGVRPKYSVVARRWEATLD